jgi:hypothetical protein
MMAAENGTFPPARKTRWLVVIAVLVALTAFSVPGFLRAIDAGSAEAALAMHYLVTRIGIAVALFPLVLWLMYLPSRSLISAMVKSGAEDPMVIRSSGELENAIKELNGITIGSSALPGKAFLVFVGVGPKFELWRWHRRQPQCVARVKWSMARSIEVDAVTRGFSTERAIVLGLVRNGRTVRLPVPAHTRRILRMTPMKEPEFSAILARFKSRLQSPTKNLSGSLG